MMSDLSITFHDLAIRLMTRLESSQERGRSGSGRVIYITSATPGEGKSFVAKGLAAHMASAGGNRIALVDANLENPWGPGTYRDLPGLSDWISSGDPVALIQGPSELQNLAVLPAGGKRMPGLAYRREAVAAVLSHLAAEYEFVFIDGGSLRGAGANSFAYQCDSVLLVVDGTSARREVVQNAIADLSLDARRFVGVVFNKNVHYIPRFLYERV